MMKKLIDVFPDYLTGGGIFTALNSLNVPWAEDDIALSLDIAYYGNRSGDKRISPLIKKIMEDDTLTTSEIETLAQTIYNIFNTNWSKQWATLSFEYNPIENYNMTESGEDSTTDTYGKTHTRTDNLTHRKTGTETTAPNLTDTRTDNLTHTKTGTDTLTLDTSDLRTDDLTHAKTGTETVDIDSTETTTPDLQNDTTNEVYGLDSSSGVPSGEQHTTSTGTNEVSTDSTNTTTYNTTDTDTGTQTLARTGTETNGYNTSDTDTGTQTTTRTGTDTLTYNTSDADTGTQTDTDGGEDLTENEHTLTRSGNIGVTTSQQMIQSERDLWIWNYFNDVVFPDVDKMLTLKIY